MNKKSRKPSPHTPDYTPFSISGSVHKDGVRKADEITDVGGGLVAILLLLFFIGVGHLKL